LADIDDEPVGAPAELADRPDGRNDLRQARQDVAHRGSDVRMATMNVSLPINCASSSRSRVRDGRYLRSSDRERRQSSSSTGGTD